MKTKTFVKRLKIYNIIELQNINNNNYIIKIHIKQSQ